MASLEDKKEHATETALALGNSGDERALMPLVELLDSDNHWSAASAARGLGYFGGARAEGSLIKALSGDNVFRTSAACKSLAKVGTAAAVPALEKLAKDDSCTGVMNLRGAAQHAVEAIEKRRKASSQRAR